jgi:hypothetical protein
MRLPQISRIILEDLPSEVKDWISKVTDPINNFMLTIKNGLNKGITVNENLAGAIKTLTVSGNAVAFSYASSRPPQVVLLGSWINLTTTSWTPTGGISIKWEYSKGQISCTFYGMASADKYEITLLILDD